MAFAIQALYRHRFPFEKAQITNFVVQYGPSNDDNGSGFIHVQGTNQEIQQDYLNYGQIADLGITPSFFKRASTGQRQYDYCAGGVPDRTLSISDAVVCISYKEGTQIVNELNLKSGLYKDCGDQSTDDGYAKAIKTSGCYTLPSAKILMKMPPIGPPMAISQGGQFAYGCIKMECHRISEFKFPNPKSGVFENVGIRLARTR
jgi:hypothetical protein